MKKIVLFLVLLCSAVSLHAYRNYTLYLYTYPNSIIADGKSSCDISAEVYDDDGNRVEDGIRVDFATTLGNITPYDQTSGGVATAVLRSVPAEGTAIVTATIPSYGVAARTTIDFLAPGTEIVKDSFFVIDSDVYLGYDSESRIIDTVGGFTAQFKGVSFEGYEAQIDTLKNTVKMRANLGEFFILKKQDKEIKAEELYFALNTGKGYAYIYDEDNSQNFDRVKPVSVRLSDLKCEDIEEIPDNVSFKIEPIEESSVYVTGDLFILDPKKEIKAKNAKIYVAGKKIVDMPWQRINVRDANGVFGTPISVGTNGLSMNVPVHYFLSKNGSGAVRFQRNKSGDGTFSNGNDMWRVDVENEYGTGTDSQGMFNLTTVNKQLGARFNNTTKLPNSATFRGSLDYPNHQNVYSNLEFKQDLEHFYYSIQGKTYNYRNSPNRYYLSGYVQTQARPLLKIKNLNWTVSNQVYVDTSYEEKEARVANKTGLDIYTNTIKLGDFSINANASYYHKFQRLFSGDSYGFNINGNIFFGQYGNFGIHYTFLKEKFDTVFDNRYISGDFGVGSDFIRFSGNGTYNFTDKNYSLYGEVGIYPWSTWSLKFFTTYQYYYGEDKYIDYKIALGKAIGFTEVRVVWTQSRKRVDLEIGNVSF
ncbi:MAG: hypothetical protein KBT47_04395 [Armatimonadetes bacterium]|nr:hypothetical protein [Candidatus Hippobium faecium]